MAEKRAKWVFYESPWKKNVTRRESGVTTVEFRRGLRRFFGFRNKKVLANVAWSGVSDVRHVPSCVWVEEWEVEIANTSLPGSLSTMR